MRPRTESPTVPLPKASRIAILAALALLVALAGCSNSGSEPVEQVFSHTLGLEEIVTETFPMDQSGFVRIFVDEISPVAEEVSETATLLFGFGLGTFDDNGDCVPSTRRTFRTGDLAVFRLSSGIYCMNFVDPGGIGGLAALVPEEFPEGEPILHLTVRTEREF